MNKVRVRFAPSPTGFLHLGGLRTALYNYLFAKQGGGKFILRVEDTDQSRIVPGAINHLISTLKWVGINHDEGPGVNKDSSQYIQSQRLHLYKKYTDELLENRSAYRCFCSQRRLSFLKKSQIALKEYPRYDNKCRSLSEDEIQSNLSTNTPFTVRLKLPPGKVTFTDMLHGDVTNSTVSESDPVLMKSDGFPTYHLANVVDDHLMDISHVIRGQEWLASTPKHTLLYSALNWEPPTFVHLPLIVNPDGKKLSKRQGDVFVEDYKLKGYTPASVLNFVCLGSGFKFLPKDLPILGDQFSSAESVVDELCSSFQLDKVKPAPSVFEFCKMNEFNTKVLKHTANNEKGFRNLVEELRNMVNKELTESSFVFKMSAEFQNEYIERICRIRLEHVNVLKDLVCDEEYQFLWIRPEYLKDVSHVEQEILKEIISCLNKIGKDVKREEINKEISSLIKQHDIKYAAAMKMLRNIMTGRRVGPSVAEIIEILGNKEAIFRLTSVLENCLNKN